MPKKRLIFTLLYDSSTQSFVLSRNFRLQRVGNLNWLLNNYQFNLISRHIDELIVLDIDATINRSLPNFSLIAKLAAESRMPLCYGGGVSNSMQATRLVDIGVEKVAVSSAAIADPSLLTEMAAAVGRQSVVAVLDVRKRKGLLSSGYEVWSHNCTINHKLGPIDLARQFQDAGAGEILVNSIDRDGLMQGYDLDLAIQLLLEQERLDLIQTIKH